MDAGLAAIVGAVIGAIAGVGGSWLQATAARTTAREADKRRQGAETADRVRAFRVRSIEETRASLGTVLDWHELTSSGRRVEADALDKQFWSPKEKPGTRVMNLSLLGDVKLTQEFFEMRRRLTTHTGVSVEDVAEIQNMRVLVMGLLSVQERLALADEPPFSVHPTQSAE